MKVGDLVKHAPYGAKPANSTQRKLYKDWGHTADFESALVAGINTYTKTALVLPMYTDGIFPVKREPGLAWYLMIELEVINESCT